MRKTLIALVSTLLMMAPAWATKVEVVESKGGVRAWLVHDPNTAVVSLCFAFRCGSAYDVVGKEGRAALYTRLFAEDRQDWKKADFIGTLNNLGADISVHSLID